MNNFNANMCVKNFNAKQVGEGKYIMCEAVKKVYKPSDGWKYTPSVAREGVNIMYKPCEDVRRNNVAPCHWKALPTKEAGSFNMVVNPSVDKVVKAFNVLTDDTSTAAKELEKMYDLGYDKGYEKGYEDGCEDTKDELQREYFTPNEVNDIEEDAYQAGFDNGYENGLADADVDDEEWDDEDDVYDDEDEDEGGCPLDDGEENECPCEDPYGTPCAGNPCCLFDNFRNDDICDGETHCIWNDKLKRMVSFRKIAD